MMKFIACFLTVSILLTFQVSAYRVGSVKLPSYAKHLEIPKEMKIITLRGSWQQMGLQYGKAADKEIAEVYDGYMDEFEAREMPLDALKKGIHQYITQINALSPQFIDFMEGIAAGAAPAFAKSAHNSKLSHLYKIIFINTYFEFMMYDFWMPAGCTAWAVSKEYSGTARMCGINRDLPFWPNIYQVALHFYPSDSQARPFMQTVTAGWVGSNGGMNADGLFVGQTKVSHDSGTCYGYPAILLNTYLLAYCKNVQDACNLLSKGNRRYREKTGYSALMQSTAMNYLLCDKKDMLVFEKEKFRYALRRPGYFGEEAHYIVCTNHFTCTYSYNELHRRTRVPMTKFGESLGTPWWPYTSSRFNTALFLIENNRKKITLETAELAFCGQQKYYDRDGKEITKVNDPDTGSQDVSPVDYGFTIDNKFMIGNIWYGGTVAAHIADIDSGTLYFTLGLPSDWHGQWQQMNLEK